MEVIVMKEERKEGSAMITGVIGASISPLAGDGLDEAFGLAIGLGAVGFGEGVFEPELVAGSGKEFGAVGGAAIGEEALDFDAMGVVEAESLIESGEDAGEFFVWKETGEGEAGMVVDGDVETFDAGPWIADGAVAGCADAWAKEAAQLLDVEVEELAGMVPFVTDHGRFGRLQGREAVEVSTAQHPGESRFRDGQHHPDLSIGTALASERKDLRFELGAGLARLAQRSRGMIVQALGEPSLLGAGEPATDGLFTDSVSGGGGAQGETELMMSARHLGSRERSKSGISVHVFRAGRRWAEC
jgi:hypothetical protein